MISPKARDPALRLACRTPQELRAQLHSPACCLVLAEASPTTSPQADEPAAPGQLCGFLLAMARSLTVHVVRLVVAPTHRRRGVARLLLQVRDCEDQ